MVDIKFCGLTRPEDAAQAVALGAAYCGVIFAGGPRLVTPDRARAVLAPVTAGAARRVGVFGAQSAEEIAEVADAVGLDVLQLHGGAPRDLLIALRERGAWVLWPVVHVRPGESSIAVDAAGWYSDGAAGVVLDAAVAGRLGGTGVALEWAGLAPEVRRLRRHGAVVLAGGLTPGNVARAVASAAPDVVDVSSGVESAPGVKDPERMRRFAVAARHGEMG